MRFLQLGTDGLDDLVLDRTFFNAQRQSIDGGQQLVKCLVATLNDLHFELFTQFEQVIAFVHEALDFGCLGIGGRGFGHLVLGRSGKHKSTQIEGFKVYAIHFLNSKLAGHVWWGCAGFDRAIGQLHLFSPRFFGWDRVFAGDMHC